MPESNEEWLMIKIAVLGYGTVGSGVVEVLSKNHEKITQRAGREIEVKYVLDLRDFPGDPIQEKVVHDYNIIAKDPEVSVVVETMGGVHPAYEFVKEALESGKSVCTSNKELVAKHGAELLAIAKEKNVNFLFEASVGGGIPIIRPLNQSLTADEIQEITGILNGTTNYILTKMAKEGVSFATALKEAQEKGYAERNPEADVEGFDACRKIAILTSLAYGMQVDHEDIYTEGITKVTDVDISYAREMGAAIKLLGTGKKVGNKVYAMISPVLVNSDNPLYSVNDVFNGIFVRGNLLGDVMFYGAGAGKFPTASAVVSDVVDAVKHLGTNIMTIWSSEKLELADYKEAARRFFVRVPVAQENLAKKLFGNVQEVDAGILGDFGFITPVMTEYEYEEKAAQLEVRSMLRMDF